MNTIKWIRTKLVGVLTTLLLSQTAGAAYLAPSPYLSFADSPFSGLAFGSFQLQTFESGAISTPGVKTSAGIVLSDGSTDSVDSDDGSIDGSGLGGHSWYSNGAHSLSFAFSASVPGGLPTHVGIVWTDVGISADASGSCPTGIPHCGTGDVLFEAFDATGHSLGVTGPYFLGDGDFRGQTAEDRFFGVINGSGISRIEISMPGSGDWEVDHLQYGIVAVPEPSNLALLLAGLVMLGGIAHRRSK